MLSLIGVVPLGVPGVLRVRGNYYHVRTNSLDCGSTNLCGVLTLETGLGSGYYQHPAPGVHGLWPETGSYGTSACVAPSVSTANPTTLFSCYEDPSADPAHQLEFEQHEWAKHGACAGVKDATDFFTQVCALSSGPLAVMTTSRNAGKTASADFAADLAAAGYPVFANDDQYGQVELTTCADASGTWHIAAASDFVSTCGSTRPSPGPTPSPTPTPGTKQCVRNQHVRPA